MKRTLLTVSPLFCSLVLLGSTPAHAQSFYNSGTITTIDQNAQFAAGRGVCIQMSPAIANGPWACLSTSNGLYREITALLYAAYLAVKQCSIELKPCVTGSIICPAYEIGDTNCH